jgi:hypothetical protein
VDATNNPYFRTSQTLQSPSQQMSARSSPQLVSADGKAKRGQGKPKDIFDARANSRRPEISLGSWEISRPVYEKKDFRLPMPPDICS